LFEVLFLEVRIKVVFGFWHFDRFLAGWATNFPASVFLFDLNAATARVAFELNRHDSRPLKTQGMCPLSLEKL
jgi:hypothetical protein